MLDYKPRLSVMYITFHFFYEVTIKYNITFQIPGPLGNSVLFNNEHKSNLSFNSKNLPTVRVFSLTFPPGASKDGLKKHQNHLKKLYDYIH